MTERGRAVRADYTRRSSPRPPSRRRWTQELEGSPFAAARRGGDVRGGARRRRPAAREVTLELAPAPARLGAVRRRGAAARRRRKELDEALDRRSADAGAEGAVSRREQVFWGWGEPGAGPSLPRRGGGLPARRARASTARIVSRPVALEEVRLREPALAGRAARAAGGDRRACATTAPRACCAAAASRYLDLVRQRAGDCEDAPDAVVAPADARRRCWRCCRRAPRRASRSCRSAAGRAWSAASSRSAGRFAAVIALDLGRLDRVLVARRALADRRARSRACGCPRPRRAGASAG